MFLRRRLTWKSKLVLCQFYISTASSKTPFVYQDVQLYKSWCEIPSHCCRRETLYQGYTVELLFAPPPSFISHLPPETFLQDIFKGRSKQGERIAGISFTPRGPTALGTTQFSGYVSGAWNSRMDPDYTAIYWITEKHWALQILFPFFLGNEALMPGIIWRLCQPFSLCKGVCSLVGFVL